MQTQLKRPLHGRRVFFVGIGGAGMAALAELLLVMGYEISGSDLKVSRTVERLRGMGVAVRVGPHRGTNADGADHVVVSAAVPPTNPEVLSAQAAGTDVISRAELLGRIFEAGRGLAVTGTHGKTTTASMLALALDSAGFQPSFLIGGDLNDVGSGAGLGSSDLVVAEADEAFGSFLELRPELVVVTNVDLDHLEYYDDQDAIDEAFLTFLSRRRPGAWSVLCNSDAGIRRISPRIAAPVATYGFEEGSDLVVDANTKQVSWRGRRVGELRLQLPGKHNLLNAAGALAASLILGAAPEPVLEALRSYRGVERRFSLRGERGGVTVIDDYAHNPRKVAAALEAGREAYPERRLVALFQPHLYSRTLHLADEFGPALSLADVVVVTDVYGAREDPIPGVSGRLVLDAVRDHGPDVIAVYVPRLEEAAGFVAGLAQPGDVVMTLGAGDVTTAAGRIISMLDQDA